MARSILSMLANAARIGTQAYMGEQADKKSAAYRDLLRQDQLSQFERGLSSRENEGRLSREQTSLLAKAAQDFTAGENVLNRNLTTEQGGLNRAADAANETAQTDRLVKQLANSLLIAREGNAVDLATHPTNSGVSFNDRQEMAKDFKGTKVRSLLARATGLMSGADPETFTSDVTDKVVDPQNPTSILGRLLSEGDYGSVREQARPFLDSAIYAEGRPAMDLAYDWNYFQHPTDQATTPALPRKRGSGTGDLKMAERPISAQEALAELQRRNRRMAPAY